MLFGFDFGFHIRWLWVALTVIFAVIEAFTLGLTTIWCALASIVMVFLSFLPIPFVFQMVIFISISAILLFFTRPIALKKFKIGKIKTNVDSLAGKHALVTKQISEFDSGEIKLDGKFWTARSEDGSTINEGTKCEVLRIEGVHAIVRMLQDNSGSESAPQEN